MPRRGRRRRDRRAGRRASRCATRSRPAPRSWCSSSAGGSAASCAPVELAGHWYDVGAEAFLARRPEARRAARRARPGAATLVHPADAAGRVGAGGRHRPMPAGTLLGVPPTAARLGAVLSPAGAGRAAAERGRAAAWPPAATSRSARWCATRFGDEVVDRLVEPLLGGVYAGRADELSLGATMPALARRWPRARRRCRAAAGRRASRRDRAVRASARARGCAGARSRSSHGGRARLPAAWSRPARRPRGASTLAAGADGAADPAPRRRLAAGCSGPARARRPSRRTPWCSPCRRRPAARLLADVGARRPAARAGAGSSYASVALSSRWRSRRAGRGEPGRLSGFLVPPVEGRVGQGGDVLVTTSGRTWRRRPTALVRLRPSVGRYGEEATLQRRRRRAGRPVRGRPRRRWPACRAAPVGGAACSAGAAGCRSTRSGTSTGSRDRGRRRCRGWRSPGRRSTASASRPASDGEGGGGAAREQ